MSRQRAPGTPRSPYITRGGWESLHSEQDALWKRRREDPESIAAACRGPNGREWLMRWLPARAHDNGLFLIFSNGIGIDDDEVRTGNSMILDPYGRILAESTSVEDDIVLADLDPSLRRMCTGVRWITARRPDLYGPLLRRDSSLPDAGSE